MESVTNGNLTGKRNLNILEGLVAKSSQSWPDGYSTDDQLEYCLVYQYKQHSKSIRLHIKSTGTFIGMQNFHI